MLEALRSSALYELKHIRNSWYKIMLLTLIPLSLAILIISIFGRGVVYKIPVVVVDNDHSKLSRLFTTHLDSSPTMDITYRVSSTKEALSLVQSAKAYTAIIIPHDFEKSVMLHLQPKITAMINTQYILIGKIITADLTSIVMKSSAEIEYIKSLADTQNSSISIAKVAPIGIQITPFFNTYKNYFYFLVSALIPAIWQIFIVITMLIAIGGMTKEHRLGEFFKDRRHTLAKLIGLALPYTVIYTLWGVVFLLYLYSQWSFQGSFTVLIFALFLTVIAYQSVALLLFVTGFDYAKSLSLGAVYTAPAFAFLGITFPIYSMNDFALLWRDILPLSHYLQIQISQANYGADIWLESDRLMILASFLIVLIPVVLRFKSYLSKEIL